MATATGEFISQEQLAKLPLPAVLRLPPVAWRLPKVAERIAEYRRGLRAMLEARLALARKAANADEAGRHFRAADRIRRELAAV